MSDTQTIIENKKIWLFVGPFPNPSRRCRRQMREARKSGYEVEYQQSTQKITGKSYSLIITDEAMALPYITTESPK